MLIGASQALFNHFGIRLTSLLTDFSGYSIMVVAVVLTVAMFAFAPTHDFGRLFVFQNASGHASGDVWPVEPGRGDDERKSASSKYRHDEWPIAGKYAPRWSR